MLYCSQFSYPAVTTTTNVTGRDQQSRDPIKKKKIELLNCLQLMSITFHIVYAQAAFWLFFRGLTENNENCFFRRQQPVLWESLTYSACSLYIETNAMHSLSQNVRNVREHQKFFQVFSNDQRVY